MYFELGWLVLGYVVCVIVLLIVADILMEKVSRLVSGTQKYAVQSAIQHLGNELYQGEKWLIHTSDRSLLKAIGKHLMDSKSKYVDMRELRRYLDNERRDEKLVPPPINP